MKHITFKLTLLIPFLIAIFVHHPIHPQDPFGFSEESRWPYGPIYSVAQYGDMVYFGDGSVLMIYNISDPNNPAKLKEMEMETVPTEILAENDQLFITQEHYGLYIYDISEAGNPVFQGKYQNDGFYPIFAKQDNLGVFSTSEGIDLINLNNPASPVRMSFIELDNRPRSLAFHNKYLYVGMYEELLIYDVSDPSVPTQVHSEDYFYVPEILIIGDEAYIGQSDTMRLLDISDDLNPIELSVATDNYAFTNLVFHNGLLYTAGAGGRVHVFQRNGNNFQLIKSKSFEGYIEDMLIKDDVLLCASLHFGLEFIDVSDINSMNLMHTLSTYSLTTDVKPHQGYIYAAQGRSGLGIYQVQSNGNITQLSIFPYENTRALEIRSDIIFLAGYGEGFIILDISNPTQPVEISRTDIGGIAYELDVNGDFLYLANGKEGLSIFNISDLSNPVWLSTLPMEHITVNVRYHEDYVYVSDYRDGLKIVDVSDPARPRLKSTFKTDRDNSIYVGNVFDVEVKGNYVFVADHSYGFQVVEISDKSNPLRIDNFNTGQRPYDIEIQGNILYIALSYNGIRAYNISDPEQPERIAYHDTGGELDKIMLSDGLIYGADGSTGIIILNPWFTSSEDIQYQLPFNVNIYPNPATSQSLLEVNGNWNHPMTIRIITMDGRQLGIKNFRSLNESLTLDMNQFMKDGNRSGIYFLVVSSGTKFLSTPFMWISG